MRSGKSFLRSDELVSVATLLVASVSISASMLSGCGVSKSGMAAPSPVVGAAIGGNVHGGQQPVTGSKVYMFQAETTGYGSSAESRLDAAAITGNPAGGGTKGGSTYVLTDASGDFTITGGYTCTVGRPVYLLAEGGNPGVGAGVENDKLALMAVLGPCPAGGVFPSSENVIINEATTVAAAYALSGFLTGPTELSVPGGDALAMTGLVNATANAGQLVDISTGLARTVTPNGNWMVPHQEIYTLANILAACVNTDGTETDLNHAPTACYSVLRGVENYSAPDTLSLMLKLVGSPGPATVANLFALSTKLSPFQPALTSAPGDFTVAIVFLGGGAFEPVIPAVDAEGNVWFPSTSGTLTGLSPLGDLLTPDGGQVLFLNQPIQAAVDPGGNIWISDLYGDNIAEVTYSSPSFSTETYSVVRTQASEGTDDVHQIAIDSKGNVYVSDYTLGTIYKLDNNGLTANGYVPPGTTGLNGVALLSDKNFYAARYSSSGQEFTSDGALTGNAASCASYSDTGCGLSSPSAFAVDSVGGVWATNGGSTLAHFSLTASDAKTVSGGGLNFDNFLNWLAIDGGDHVWVPNIYGMSISEFDDNGVALSPSSTGFQNAPANCSANALAIDGSGDVWVSCRTITEPVVEFIGAAVPVYTPLTPGHFGVKP
jgi:streptogramin lyase